MNFLRKLLFKKIKPEDVQYEYSNDFIFNIPELNSIIMDYKKQFEECIKISNKIKKEIEEMRKQNREREIQRYGMTFHLYIKTEEGNRYIEQIKKQNREKEIQKYGMTFHLYLKTEEGIRRIEEMRIQNREREIQRYGMPFKEYYDQIDI